MSDGGHLDPPGPQQQAAKRRRLPLGAVLGIAGGGLVILLIVVVVVVAATLAGTVAKAAGPQPTTASARSALKSYLTAVAAGDAATANRYLGAPAGSADSRTLLTSAVLAQSKRLAPISHIVVGKATGSRYYPEVAATYSVGSTAVSTTYHLSQDEQLGYTVTGGLARLDAAYLTGLDVTINGVKATVPEAGFQVFPGAYAVAVTTPSLTLAGDGRVVLGAPDADLDLDALKPKLTDEGLRRFRTLVAASVKRCLGETTLKAGCGLTIPKTLSDGITVDEGSVHRSSTPQLKAKLDHLEPTPDVDTPTLMTASIGESPEVKATGTKNGVHGSFSLLFGPSFRSASIDVSQSEPTVEWG